MGQKKIIYSVSSASIFKIQLFSETGKPQLPVKYLKFLLPPNTKTINNRGYNKYLKIDGEVKVAIDYEKFEADKTWDGLKRL